MTRLPIIPKPRRGTHQPAATKFRRLWTWRADETAFYAKQARGSVLHVCCGDSLFGDVRVDVDHGRAGATVLASYRHLPFRDNSFSTVICDPPWAKSERLDAGLSWLWELRRVARSRIVIIHPSIFAVPGTTLLRAYAVRSRGLMWKAMAVYRVLPDGKLHITRSQRSAAARASAASAAAPRSRRDGPAT